MSPIHHFPKNILQLEFTAPHQYADKAIQKFLKSELGALYQAIPWSELARCMKKPKNETRGRKSFFSTQGKLALMFLKSSMNVSDRALMARLEFDYSLQFFCGVYLRVEDKPPHYKVISDIRAELGDALNFDSFQKALASHWLPFMNNIEEMLQDATCYETHMRYPTDVKLLWEGCVALKKNINSICKKYGIATPRSRYGEQALKQLNYSKSRKKTFNQTQARIKSLLGLLKNLSGQLENLCEKISSDDFQLWARCTSLLEILKKVYAQQSEFYQTREYPKDRIVSLDKDYIRPIVRGKESKRVEFGAKVNMIQIDGINFIEHLSFDAFHEGNRLQESILFHYKLTGVACKRLGADTIYATNANRTFCTKETIETSFLPKGRKPKNDKEKRASRIALSKRRATMMEGSFGVEKQFYGLVKIRARNASTEKLMIYFGIHTANAVRMTSKMQTGSSFSQAA